MPIDPTKLAALKALVLNGQPAACAYWLVEWDKDDPAENRYYSDSEYNKLPPYTGVGVEIEARILKAVVKDTTFEINPDLRSETIPLEFDDIDRTISGKFQTFKSGIRCELFFYYPDVNLTVSLWFGTLQAPKEYGHKTLKTVATNGFRSREEKIPKRRRPRECTANFGGRLPSFFAIESNGCPYNKHLGGIVGNNNPSTAQPYIDCPRLVPGDCFARLGRDAGNTFFLGFNTDASAVVTDRRSGYAAVSKGNESALKDPIRVIAGLKYVRDPQLLLWKRLVNNSTPDHGFVQGIWEVGEGPVEYVANFKVKEKIIEFSNMNINLGLLGQPRTSYAPDVSNFSGTAHVNAVYGWTNPLNETPNSLSAECTVAGYKRVAAFTTGAVGHGITGNVYRTQTFTDFAGTISDANFNYYGRLNEPIPGVDFHEFSIWFGQGGTVQINPRYTETYTFTLYADDSGILIINGTTVINAPTAGTYTGTIALTANIPVNIEIKYFNLAFSGDNYWSCALWWQSASQAFELVPNSRLNTASAVDLSYNRIWTDDRVWWLLELYTNQRFGMGNPYTRFNIPEFATASLWTLDDVSFTLNGADGETNTYSGRRSTFDAILEGRATAEQIVDICRSGAIAVPFQDDGVYTTVPFRPFTSAELAAAPVFTDTGDTKQVLWADGQPNIRFEQTPDDKVINEIVLTYEEAINFDVERPIKFDDPNQKLLAGRAAGDDNLKDVPKRDSAFGCRYEQEVTRLGFRTLRFGDFDEGGIQNNGRVTINCPFEWVLGIRRYGVIKVVSTLLDGFTIGTTNGVDDFRQALVYFRILKLKKLADGRAEIIAQAYNQLAYEAFEIVTTPGSIPTAFAPDPPDIIIPPTEALTFASTPTYDAAAGVIEFDIT